MLPSGEVLKKHSNVLELFASKELVAICAPMVRYSKLPFRTLVRNYNCDICFTPMILADSFCRSEKARRNEFTTSNYDSPLVVQFAANTVEDFVGAAQLVAPYSDGIDLNCGCPQRWAKAQGLGCSLLDKPELVSDLVAQCRNQIDKPFTVSTKIRIQSDLKRTVELCRRLDHCGASFITVHARTPCQNSGPADFSALSLITENVDCPVVGNGNVRSYEDALEMRSQTGCKGVMIANAILTNPAVFSGAAVTPSECVQKWLDICYNLVLDSNQSSCDPIIPERNEILTFQCFHHHLVFMLEKCLPKWKRKIFNNLQTFELVLEFLNSEFKMTPNLFSNDLYVRTKTIPCYYSKRLPIHSLPSNGLKDQCSPYNSDSSGGKFFHSKLNDECSDDEDLSNLFV